MINIWVLFVGMYGSYVPIMELNDEVTCNVYASHYAKSYERVECKHLSRRDGHFRPQLYGKQPEIKK